MLKYKRMGRRVFAAILVGFVVFVTVAGVLVLLKRSDSQNAMSSLTPISTKSGYGRTSVKIAMTPELKQALSLVLENKASLSILAKGTRIASGGHYYLVDQNGTRFSTSNKYSGHSHGKYDIFINTLGSLTQSELNQMPFFSIVQEPGKFKSYFTYQVRIA